MPMLSLIWGILALAGMVVAFFPCLGSLNWLNIPFSLVGVVIGVIALGKSEPGKKGTAMSGTIMSASAAILGFIRLVLGGGVL